MCPEQQPPKLVTTPFWPRDRSRHVLTFTSINYYISLQLITQLIITFREPLQLIITFTV